MVAIAFRFVSRNLQPLVSPPLASATLLAIILNLLFQIGIKKTFSLSVALDNNPLTSIAQKLHCKGAEWGALPNTIVQAQKVSAELVQALKYHHLSDQQLQVNVRYDDLGLQGELVFEGKAIDVQAEDAKDRGNHHDESINCKQAIHIAKLHADKLEADIRADKQVLRFFIEQ